MVEVFKESNFRVVSGGTDNHLFLLDVSNYEVNGDELEKLLDTVGITVNKNGIPFDERPPTKTSGLRIGTPAVTTRGFKEAEVKQVAEMIIRVAENQENEEVLNQVREDVFVLTAGFPLYLER